MVLKEMIMLLDLKSLRNSLSSFRWMVVFMYGLSLSVIQNGDCMQEEISSNTTVEYVIGNLQVQRPEDGVPSLDTGLYLMSRVAPFDGHVNALNACAYLMFPDPNPQGVDVISLHFYVAGYRLMGNNFQRISRTLSKEIDISTDVTFGCSMINFGPDQRTEIQKDDRLGVFVPDEDCYQFSVSPDPRYLCSAHMNIIDPVKNCSQSLYFKNIKLEDHSMPVVLDAINGHPVEMFINVDVFIEPEFPQEVEEPLSDNCAVKFIPEVFPNRTVIAALSTVTVIGFAGALFLLVIVMLVCAVVSHNKRKVKRLKESVTAGITTYSDHLNHQNQFDGFNHRTHRDLVESNHSYVINSLGGHSNHFVTEQSHSHLEESCHSYVINSLGQSNNNRADEEPYWPPASKEKGLKHQLKKSKVDEVLRNNIELKEYLGSGRFGIVYRGLLIVTEEDSEGGVKEVAVKTMENGASEEERVKFLQEAAIMGQFRNPYIVRIYGVLMSSQPYMLICELMSKGDLHRHLHTIKIMGTLNQNEAGAMLLSYSRQVSSAMVYLSAKGYVHCDLAARNILLSEDGVCKISDFGLTRNLQDEDYYVAKTGIIPLRWTAPEAIQNGKFSTASDVWSYGVVLYEIWSLASKPYGNLTNEHVISKILEGHRLLSPPGCPRAIYHKMISCWHPDASHRPTFSDLQISLQQPDYELLQWSEEDKAMYSENARTFGATFQEGESLFKDMQMMYEI